MGGLPVESSLFGECCGGSVLIGARMEAVRLQKILLCLVLCMLSDVRGLKCRTATDSQQNNDFEYVVRMCLRHLRNESDIYDLYRTQNAFGTNKRYRHDMQNSNNNNYNNNNNNNYNYNNNNNNDDGDDNKNYYNRNRNPEGFDQFWSPSSSSHDRNRYRDDRHRQDGDYTEFDYFGDSRNGRKKSRRRPQPPHSYQQQLQHDRDMYNRGNRDSKGYFYSNGNKNTKSAFNNDKTNDSPLADIDPCVIHCIFQEMQMVDDNGKPDKGLIAQKMTQKIWNSELKKFLQESIDECFDAIDDNAFESNRNSNSNNNGYRKPESMCDWAKTFAICLEDRGRENCDDWNEPVQKNHNSSRNSEDQKYKSKQNDRG